MATGGVPAAVMRDLECPVCHEVLQTPKMLPCGHSLCATPCLQQLAGDQDHVKCPECRADHQVPAGGTSGFPTNFFLSRIVENSKSGVCLDQSCCPGCSVDSVMLKRCYHCASRICEVCQEEHTDIMKRDLMKQFAEWSDEIVSAAFDQKESTVMKRLEEKVAAMHDEVNRVTESFHQVINKRKLELYQHIDDFKTGEVNKIQAQTQKMRGVYVDFCQEKQLILDGDVPQPLLMQLEDELCDKMVKFQSEDNDTEISDATLSVDHEKVITQSLSEFGEITDRQHVAGEPLDTDHEFKIVKLSIGKKGTEPGLFDSPTAVQVSPVTGNIVVADGKSRTINIFSHNGKFIHSFTKPYDDYKSVEQLEINTKGQIVVLCQNGIIASYNENGDCLYNRSVENAISIGLAPNDDIHVGKNGGQIVVIRQGSIVQYDRIVKEGGRADKIVINKAGIIYVLHFTGRKSCWNYEMGTYDSMFVFNSDLSFIRQMNVEVIPRDIKCLCSPCNELHSRIYTAPRDSLRLINDKYFLTADSANQSVTIYDLHWKKIKHIGSDRATVHGLGHPLDAAVTLDGNLVVVYDNNMMQFF